MTNDEELLSQVQEILDEAGKTLDSDRPEGINAEFQQVEQKNWGLSMTYTNCSPSVSYRTAREQKHYKMSETAKRIWYREMAQ